LLGFSSQPTALMAATMDTVINVCRDGAIVDLDVEFPTHKGKKLLDSDNPYREAREAREARLAAEEAAEVLAANAEEAVEATL